MQIVFVPKLLTWGPNAEDHSMICIVTIFSRGLNISPFSNCLLDLGFEVLTPGGYEEFYFLRYNAV
jgi:hypothetical protein